VGTPHSTEHEAIEIELIARASHGHALFREDNSAVCYKLEEATRVASYAASIKPCQRTKNGRDAWLALSNQHAGDDKWEAEIKCYKQLLHAREWKGQTNFALERFVQQHRNAYVSVQAAAEHVTCQLPNEHSQVGCLLDGIICNDAGLQAAMASVKTDQASGGLWNNFEAAAAHLLPCDPVQKKRGDNAGGKRGPADVSDATGEEADTSAFGAKTGKGSSGVPLCCHTTAEHELLTKAQTDELREWRKGQPKGASKKGAYKKKGGDRNKFNSNAKVIAAAVEKRLKSVEQTKTTDEETEAWIMSLVKKHNPKVQISDATADPAPVTTTAPSLKSILRKVKNSKN
jgi:hypothetical protein